MVLHFFVLHFFVRGSLVWQATTVFEMCPDISWATKKSATKNPGRQMYLVRGIFAKGGYLCA